MERLWYATEGQDNRFSAGLLHLMESLGNKYQIDELAAKYNFTGDESMTIPQAIAIKEELDQIEKLKEQLEEAKDTAQIAVIDLSELSEFADPEKVAELNEFQKQIEQYLKDIAERQGLDASDGRVQLTPKAYKLFQGKLLERIFSNMEASKTGRHQGPIIGEGAVETQRTKPYEFGDSVTHMDIPTSMVNAMVRGGTQVADSHEARRHRNPSHAQHAQMCDVRGHGHERIDALRRRIRLREAHEPRSQRSDSQRVSRRLSALHRSQHVRQTSARE